MLKMKKGVMIKSSFEDIDVPVAKYRFNKLRGYFYRSSPNGHRKSDTDGTTYYCTVDGIAIAMWFGRRQNQFGLFIGDEQYWFYTPNNWLYNDIVLVGKNFPIIEEMWEFINDYNSETV